MNKKEYFRAIITQTKQAATILVDYDNGYI
jgi:hypothetical protein